MRRLLRIGLRLLGLALVAFILTRIPYRDRLVWPDGRVERGRIVSIEKGRVLFRPAGATAARVAPTGGPSDPRPRKGAVSIVRGADVGRLLLALAFYGPITFISITRWWLLLRAIGLPIRYAEALRLCYIGFFFNSAVPGLTGGDVVKAFYIARSSRSPYRAFLSVFVDRAIGLFGLALLAGAVIAFKLGQPAFRGAAAIVYGFLAVAIAASCPFLSRGLRRRLRVDRLLERLPFSRFFTEVDRAITVYRDHPVAVGSAILLSLANHLSIVGMTLLMGRALGIAAPASHFFAIVPVCMMIAAVPLVPGGWGMREGAFAYFFRRVGVSEASSVPLSVLLGLAQLAWSLLGGIVFIARPDRITARELEAFSAEIEASAGTRPAASGS